MVKIPRDTREKTWAIFEREIQSRAMQKSKKFRLTGSWKKYLRKESGYKVYSVDGYWIRNNLCFYFGHGGHGYVHEFIPLDEIWVSTHHYDEGKTSATKCGCVVHKKNQQVSKNYFNSTVIHEITECEEMKKGNIFWKAHHIALEKEREVGLLVDPFDDSR